MATTTNCVTCYGQQRPGRSGKTKDQQVLITCFKTLTKTFRKAGMSDEELVELLRSPIVMQLVDTIKPFLVAEAKTDSAFVSAAFDIVNPNEIESTPMTDSATYDVDYDEIESIANNVEQNSIESTSVDRNDNESTCPTVDQADIGSTSDVEVDVALHL
jgi:hypothetical protein